MIRTIIADDEPWVAYRLMHLIDWGAHGFEVIGVASDGEEALSLCLLHRPEVLISDIRMPGHDGLVLLERLRAMKMDIAVVLISGYAEFAYAQQALRHGAFDYLIKQVSAEQLTQLLQRLLAHLAEKKYGYDTLFGLLEEDGATSIEQWLARAHRRPHFPLYRFYTFSIADDEYPGLWHEHSAGVYDEIVLRTGRRRASALLCFRDAEALVHEWQEPPDRYCGVSDTVAGDFPFYALYRQSDIAFCTASFWGLDAPLAFVEGAGDTDALDLLQALDTALAQGNTARAEAAVALFEAAARGMNVQQLALLFTQAAQIITRYRPDFDGAQEGMDYRRMAHEYAGVRALGDVLREGIQASDTPGESQMDSAIRFIDQAFTSELRIADLARQFHFSPSYFSTLFHRHTGQTFTKYLTDKRMAHVKGLLTHSKLSIQEVANQSGYGDYFQFNKAFKKYTGMAPNQYRRQEQASGGA